MSALKENDEITTLFDLINGTVIAKHARVWELRPGFAFLARSTSMGRARSCHSLCEGVTWIRGWPALDSPEVLALLSAQLLTRENWNQVDLWNEMIMPKAL